MKRKITTIEFSPSGIVMLTGFSSDGGIHVLHRVERNDIPCQTNGLLESKFTYTCLMEMIQETKDALKDDSLGQIIVLLPGDNFQTKQASHRSLTLQNNKVSLLDYKNCTGSMIAKSKMDGFICAYCDPSSFIGEDTYSSQEFPMGQSYRELTINADLHYISDICYLHYCDIVKKCINSDFITLVSAFGNMLYLNSFQGIGTNYCTIEIEDKHTYVSFIEDRHLKSSKMIIQGMDDIIESASQVLNITPERMKELLSLFGLRSEAGFAYLTDEKLSLEKISCALRTSLDVLFTSIQKEIDNMPNNIFNFFLSGKACNIDGLDDYLGKFIKHRVMFLKVSIIGAKEKNNNACFGAIKLMEKNYMSHSYDNDSSSLNGSQFTRG